MAVAALIVAVLAVVIAGASAFYTWRQASYIARATAVEEERRHEERTPTFELRVDRASGANWYKLWVRSRDHEQRLDSVTVKIDCSIDGRPGPLLGFTPDQDGVIVPAGSALTAIAEYGPAEPLDDPVARRVERNDKPHDDAIILSIVARSGTETWTSQHQTEMPPARPVVRKIR